MWDSLNLAKNKRIAQSAMATKMFLAVVKIKESPTTASAFLFKKLDTPLIMAVARAKYRPVFKLNFMTV